MTPNEYLKEIAIPTAQEFWEDTGNRRRAYLACQTSFHLCDFIHVADSVAIGTVRGAIQTQIPFAFQVVDGVANGSKHCARRQGAYRHQAGEEREAMPFTLGHSFLDHDRLDIAGLEIVHDGRTAFLDECLHDFLKAASIAYPLHFTGVDLSWLTRS